MYADKREPRRIVGFWDFEVPNCAPWSIGAVAERDGFLESSELLKMYDGSVIERLDKEKTSRKNVLNICSIVGYIQ